MWEPHSGQTQESSCQRWPAATQVTSLAVEAAQVTIGSSALATTCRPAPSAEPTSRSASRHSAAIIATSLARSSWSRLRLSSATTRGCVALRTCRR
jgi:hypothetical protein